MDFRWPGRWRTAAEAALGLIYPNCCQLCGAEPASAAEGYVGPACRRTLRWIHPPFCARCGLPFAGAITDEFACANCADLELAFESARAAVVAEGLALEVIHRFKYQRARWFEVFLGDLLVQAAVPKLSGGDWDWVVPVPLHPVKLRHREFNQAERLARQLAHAVGRPLRADLIQRVEPTLTQTHLSREERDRNVRNAFHARPNARLNGGSVVLVDDVLTTGATTNAIAGVLRDLGADRVCVWSVARAVLSGPPTA